MPSRLTRKTVAWVRRLFLSHTLEEIRMAHVFKDSIVESDWLRQKSFSPSGYAANYTFLYVLFRILDDIQPQAVLELGAGQTTRMTAQYVAYGNPKAMLTLVEHDPAWLSRVQARLPEHAHIRILTPAVEPYTVEGCRGIWYHNLPQQLESARFDLMVIDGPVGTPQYSRAGFLDLIPQHLADTFVIVMDDCHRSGERQTVARLRCLLNARRIPYGEAEYVGTKSQRLFYSPQYAFLKSI